MRTTATIWSRIPLRVACDLPRKCLPRLKLRQKLALSDMTRVLNAEEIRKYNILEELIQIYWSKAKSVKHYWPKPKSVKHYWSKTKSVKHDWSKTKSVKHYWSKTKNVNHCCTVVGVWHVIYIREGAV